MGKKVNLSKEDFDALSQWEHSFDCAVHSHYYFGVGVMAVMMINDIFCKYSETDYRINPNCGSCIMEIMVPVGEWYFAKKESLAREAVKKASKTGVKSKAE